MVLSFGGYQSGPGSVFGIPYQAGGLIDHVVELFAGPHDWLGNPWSYNAIGDNAYAQSTFGAFLGGGKIASFMDKAMGGIDIPLAAPFAIGTELGTNSYALAALTHKK